MVLLASSAINRRFEPWSGHTKDYTICVCCFFAKPAAIRRKSNDWLARNQNNMSEWNNISTRGLLFEWTSTIQINQACWSRTKPTSSPSHWKLTCSPWYSWKIAELALCNNHSFTHSELYYYLIQTGWWPIYSGLPPRPLIYLDVHV